MELAFTFVAGLIALMLSLAEEKAEITVIIVEKIGLDEKHRNTMYCALYFCSLFFAVF